MTDAEQREWITTSDAADLLGRSADHTRTLLTEYECERREISAKSHKWRRSDVLAVRDLHKFHRRGQDAPNYCTPDGANRLKARIEAFWRERGHTVTVELIETPAPAGTPRVDIRSDMVDGLPVK